MIDQLHTLIISLVGRDPVLTTTLTERWWSWRKGEYELVLYTWTHNEIAWVLNRAPGYRVLSGGTELGLAQAVEMVR